MNAQYHLTKVVEELFPDRPTIVLELAIRAGHQALDRGEPFFDALVKAEAVINEWWGADDLLFRRNVERVTEYRIKRMWVKLVEQLKGLAL